MPVSPRWIIGIAFVCVTLLVAAGIARYGYGQALDQLTQRSRADLALASDRLTSQLRRYQELAVLMAEDPRLLELAGSDGGDDPDGVLQAAADRTGAIGMVYADPSGRVLAQAGVNEPDLARRPYFIRALHSALGASHKVISGDRRVFAYAAPSLDDDGALVGVLVVYVDLFEVEWDWIGGLPVVFFTDASGVVFISNRSELLFWQQEPDGAWADPAGTQLPFDSVNFAGFEIWQVDWGAYLPERALHLTRPLPVIGMTAHVLSDVAQARWIAGLQAGVFAVLCLAFGSALLQLSLRRRELSMANAQLESRVQARTRELSSTNSKLRQEVADRQEAEAALKRAQDDLVQAGKLSALGQMSAGISHELNQPLMAIQQFADNGARFLEKGNTDRARDNLGRIAKMAIRMGRIIRNLRAFAKQESVPMGRVDLGAVIEQAVELSEARLTADQVRLDWTPPRDPVLAYGGEVRLVQVFVNLIGNAADAMSESQTKEIRITIETTPTLSVEVRDTGPGIAEPERIFDPFYSTKSIGSAEGMGLGLSISYGLVQSFGGNIKGSNAPDGGAIFRVELEPWTKDQGQN